MAYIANQIDYDLAKKANPNADVRLYKPGMAISSNDVVLGGSSVIPDSVLNGAQRVYGADRDATQTAFQNYDTNIRPLNEMKASLQQTKDEIKSSLQNQLTAQTNLYNQQASDQALKVKQAIARQAQQGEATKTDYTNQMNTAIGTLNTERGKIPGQVTNLNNQASAQGIANTQRTRNNLAQMNLLQSGESASQQLLNDTTTENNINANNLQGQQLNADFGTKIATAQTDLASKIKQINDAISLAQVQGDESSLAILQDAQAKIANAGAQSALDYNNWAYKATQDATTNRMTQQQIDARNVQNALDNVFRQSQADQQARQFQDTFGLQKEQLASDISYKNSALELSRMKASSGGSSGGGMSVSELNYLDKASTTQANNNAFKVLNDMASNGATRSEILTYANQHYNDFVGAGANFDDVIARAKNAFTWEKDANGTWYNLSTLNKEVG
ncbi:hypothetical protein [Desulfitobacterium metallireducens]|uniref:Uncharacterized protein n=1 Tax=Desulfitobacterium metallireducens DSM 15288 TaxID=871968 RepID=W0EGB2_9FIRM|nr:hypothetical protein [Desulfitobacterium metallireducens]AHF08558.1 hypothetical protein DESME_08860 [Desulfitobacterium metallireducens DSM 15288]